MREALHRATLSKLKSQIAVTFPLGVLSIASWPASIAHPMDGASGCEVAVVAQHLQSCMLMLSTYVDFHNVNGFREPLVAACHLCD